MSLSKVETLENGAAARLVWTDGTSARFHAMWLRDNALDPETRSPGNGQRLITVLDIPRDDGDRDAAVSRAATSRVTFAPEGKAVTFPVSAGCRRASTTGRARQTRAGPAPEIELWDSRLQAQRADRLLRGDQHATARRSAAGSPTCAATASR